MSGAALTALNPCDTWRRLRESSIRLGHKSTIIAVLVGDYYEVYGADAELIAKLLEITLTSCDDNGTRIPMVGMPWHSIAKYVAPIFAAGLRVALFTEGESPQTFIPNPDGQGGHILDQKSPAALPR